MSQALCAQLADDLVGECFEFKVGAAPETVRDRQLRAYEWLSGGWWAHADDRLDAIVGLHPTVQIQDSVVFTLPKEPTPMFSANYLKSVFKQHGVKVPPKKLDAIRKELSVTMQARLTHEARANYQRGRDAANSALLHRVNGRKAELARKRTQLSDYLMMKRGEGDWHGVQDAASDLRDIEAEVAGLNAAERMVRTDEGQHVVGTRVGGAPDRYWVAA